MALAVSQCLWGLCRNADEHRVRLDEVLVLAGNFHEHLSLEDRSQLAEGLSEIKLEATKECLLAVA
ncbi:MAG TPA: hypothetical protein VFP32_01635 [Candidatus Saccharimonadales bacterium]|nr:hypothetical protein [Candidatus Saccharimonadales bacterium]